MTDAPRQALLGPGGRRHSSSPAWQAAGCHHLHRWAALQWRSTRSRYWTLPIWPFVDGALRELQIPAALRRSATDRPRARAISQLGSSVSWGACTVGWVEASMYCGERHARAGHHAMISLYSLKMVTSSMRWARISLRSRSMTAGSSQGGGCSRRLDRCRVSSCSMPARPSVLPRPRSRSSDGAFHSPLEAGCNQSVCRVDQHGLGRRDRSRSGREESAADDDVQFRRCGDQLLWIANVDGHRRHGSSNSRATAASMSAPQARSGGQRRAGA